MAESAAQTATRELVALLPELQEALDEHIRDNEIILAHVFFGDVCRFAEEVARTHDDVTARKLSAALERMATSGEADVLNVLEVSFVEYFEWGDEEEQAALAWLSPFFGPAMLARVEAFRAYSARMEAAGDARGGFSEWLESLLRSRPWRRKSRRAFERRARRLVGLRLAAVRYVGGINTDGYERAPGIDTTSHGVELIGDDQRYVYITSEYGDFNVVTWDRPLESARTVWDLSSDDRWRPYVGRTLTRIEISSYVDNEPVIHVPLIDPLVDSLFRARWASSVKASFWIGEKFGRERPRGKYVPYALTFHFGDRRLWITAPIDDHEGDYFAMSVAFEEDAAERLERRRKASTSHAYFQ